MRDREANFLERLAISRPGYRLLELVDAAIPVFLVKADVLLIERRPIGPIDEFVLKAVDLGFVTPAEIGGILGLEQQLVTETIVDLQRSDHLHQRSTNGYRTLQLTTRGTVLLNERLKEAPMRSQVRIGFDRLTWEVSAEAQGHLMRPAELAASGRWELRPKIGRRVNPGDLVLDDIERQVRSIQARTIRPTVVAVEQIVRADRLFMPAEVGIFQSTSGEEIQLAVLVDRRPSPRHESALERLGGMDFVGGNVATDEPDPRKSLEADYGPDTADDLIEQAPTALERDLARRDRVASEPELADEAESTAEVPRLPTSAVEFIDTFEHPQYLQMALTASARRLVIISPWITAAVVGQLFLERLERLLRAGVRVHIGYGLEQRPGERPASKADRTAEQGLQHLAARHANFTFVKLGNTHSKQLLFDDVHVSGSFNWLSFRGSPSREYRHEESTVVRLKDRVDAKYADLCSRLDGAPDR